MKQMEAQISGINKMNGLSDTYEVRLSVPDMQNGMQGDMVPVRLIVRADMIDAYKRLYMTEEKFNIVLPG